MRIRDFLAMLALAASGLCPAQQPSTPQQQFQQLSQATSLDGPGMKPWHLILSFQLHDIHGSTKPVDTGTVEVWFLSPGTERIAVKSGKLNLTMDDLQLSADHADREVYLLNTLLSQVIQPLSLYKKVSDFQMRTTDLKIAKVKLACFIVSPPSVATASPRKESPSFSGTSPEFCVDPTDPGILRLVYDNGGFIAIRNHLATYAGINLALDNALMYDNAVAITGHVDTLQSYTPTAADQHVTAKKLPAMIPGMVLAGWKLKNVVPEYPYVARVYRRNGHVVLAAIIGKDGKISSLDPIASSGPVFTQSAYSAVKQWTYHPYMLNGQPTEVDTTITVNYVIDPN